MMETLITEFSQIAGSLAVASMGLGLLGLIATHLPLSHVYHQRILLTILALILAAPVVILSRPEFGRMFPATSSAPPAAIQTANVSTMPIVASDEFPIRLSENAFEWPDATNLAAFAWLAGSALLVFWSLFQLARLHNRLENLSPPNDATLARIADGWPEDSPFAIDDVAVLTDPAASGPYSFFGRTPHLVLPDSSLENFSTNQITAILAHELSHLRHRDSWHLLAWKSATALQWWNPFVWLLHRKAERLMEYRADNACTDSPQGRIDFARLLISTAASQMARTQAPSPAPAQAMGSGGAAVLGSRVRRLLDTKSSRVTSKPWAALLAVALVGGGATWLIGCASVAPVQAGSRNEVVGGLRLTGQTAQGKEIDARLRKMTGRVQGASEDSEALVAITWFEFSDPNQKAIRTPLATVLGPREADDLVSELKQRKGFRLVRYPRMLTYQDQPVHFRSVINQPYLADSESSRNDQGGATETAEVEYVSIGTICGMLPVKRKNGTFQVAADLSFSDIIGEDVIDGDPYPVLAKQSSAGVFELENGGAVFLQMPGDIPGEPGKSRAVLFKVESIEKSSAPGK